MDLLQAERPAGEVIDRAVKMLGGLMLVSTVALTLADYVFKSTVAQRIPPEDLGMFFANFEPTTLIWRG